MTAQWGLITTQDLFKLMLCLFVCLFSAAKHLNQHQVATFAWHPTQENRMLALSSGGSMQDIMIYDAISLVSCIFFGSISVIHSLCMWNNWWEQLTDLYVNYLDIWLANRGDVDWPPCNHSQQPLHERCFPFVCVRFLIVILVTNLPENSCMCSCEVHRLSVQRMGDEHFTHKYDCYGSYMKKKNHN